MAVHEGDVRHGIYEPAGILDHPATHGVAPEIFGLFKLIENLDCLGHIHLAVSAAVGRVAQLANARVPGAGVVPAVGTFLRQLGGDFIELNLQVRLQIFQHAPQRGAHHAAADQNDVRILNVLNTTHKGPTIWGKNYGKPSKRCIELLGSHGTISVDEHTFPVIAGNRVGGGFAGRC